MTMTLFRWYGLLCNVDFSILKLPLSHGFEIKYFTEKEAVEHFISIGMINGDRGLFELFSLDMPIYNDKEKRVYYIFNEELLDVNISEEGRLESFPSASIERIYHDEIRDNIRLLRLYTGGDIRVPIRYSCFEFNGEWRRFVTMESHKLISFNKFHLKEEDLDAIIDLFKFKLPFKVKEINLAFDNYEDSFETDNRSLSFLSLMMAMESLFNLGRGELRYRISRNCAVLLGKDLDDSIEIFKDIKEIYDTRSDLVHSGVSKKLNDDMVFRLKKYVRHSIIAMLYLNESKKVILAKLNLLGFGEITKYDEIQL